MKTKIILITSLLILSMPCFSMGGSLFNKTANYGRRMFHYIKNNPEKIALSVPALGIGYIVKKNLDVALFPLKDSDPYYGLLVNKPECNQLQQIRPIIDEELQKNNIDPHAVNIGIHPVHDNNYGAAYKNLLIISALDFCKAGLYGGPGGHIEFRDAEENIIESWTYETNTEEEKASKREEIRWALQHEIGHLKDNATLQRATTQSITPIASFGCYVGMLKKYSHLIPSRITRSLLAASSILPIVITGNIVNLTYARHLEKRADNNVPNQREYLEGGIRWLKKQKKALDSHIQCGHLPNIDNGISYYLLNDHPTYQSRIDKLQKRLDKLNAEQ